MSGEGARTLWRVSNRIINLSRRPCVMGILNVTPDSFSDGNRYDTIAKAVERAVLMEEEGADIIDIGGESTRPSADPVSLAEELDRVMPVIERLAGAVSVPLSIDTYKAAVARAAIGGGVEIVNDISGLTFDADMPAVVSSTGAGVVVMHTRGTPETMQLDTRYDDLLTDVIEFLRRSLSIATGAGIDAQQVVVDPGIGFGKGTEGNMEILRRLGELHVLGRPVLVGTSRKAFIGSVLGREVNQRLFGTAATIAIACVNGASLFRVHDVKEMRDVLDMTAALLP